MTAQSLPSYSVRELNASIGSLLKRGFAPQFILNATVTKSQIKKGHCWISLTDGEANIDAVIWASRVKTLRFIPTENEGVVIIGKLNYWENQARLSVQVIDIRPSKSAVFRRFEIVKEILLNEGLIDDSRRRNLPRFPSCIAILTSVPSSALADILRTSNERWPLAKILIFPIPVQGFAAKIIHDTLIKLSLVYKKLSIDAIVLARGGGNREDLMVFDDENVCRQLANFPIPVVTGIGHEDDLTVADLVADHRSATPTAAIVQLLPSRESALLECMQKNQRINDYFLWLIKNEQRKLIGFKKSWELNSPLFIFDRHRNKLIDLTKILEALSPKRLLQRGFAMVSNRNGKLIRSVRDVALDENLEIQLEDGYLDSKVNQIFPCGDY